MVSERLGQYIENKNISFYAFENSIDASRGSISKAVKEGKSIGSTVIENILSVYEDLNPVWLLTGKENMILENSDRVVDKNSPKKLSEFTHIEIINYISDHIEDFKDIRSFRLLLKSIYTDDEISDVRNEIEELKRKVSSLITSQSTK
ncbi:hypothetical protein [Aquimarina sp. SS2-1]|uniref:hypothetical protein n=1 Tax=Aquimarina besae TaxID=3342247 RepID=UPI00366CF7B8